MRTKQHFLVERPGAYRGFSTEFSGPGFAWMNYTVHTVSPADFRQWVEHADNTGTRLSYTRFKAFAQPTVNVGNRSQVFNQVDSDLFRQVIQKVRSGQLMHQKPLRMTEDMYSDIFKRHAN